MKCLSHSFIQLKIETLNPTIFVQTLIFIHVKCCSFKGPHKFWKVLISKTFQLNNLNLPNRNCIVYFCFSAEIVHLKVDYLCQKSKCKNETINWNDKINIFKIKMHELSFSFWIRRKTDDWRQNRFETT